MTIFGKYEDLYDMNMDGFEYVLVPNGYYLNGPMRPIKCKTKNSAIKKYCPELHIAFDKLGRHCEIVKSEGQIYISYN